MNKRMTSAAAAFVLMGAGLTASSTFAAPKSPPPASVRDAPTYVMMAGASDMFEIQSSQLVLQTTQNADLRNFAQMMITDHTNTSQQVMSAAQSSGMSPPPPQLTPEQAKMMQALQAANGRDRDNVYAKEQVTAHKMALELHSAYAARGDNPALQTVARTAVPIIQHHLTEIQRVQKTAR